MANTTKSSRRPAQTETTIQIQHGHDFITLRLSQDMKRQLKLRLLMLQNRLNDANLTLHHAIHDFFADVEESDRRELYRRMQASKG